MPKRPAPAAVPDGALQGAVPKLPKMNVPPSVRSPGYATSSKSPAATAKAKASRGRPRRVPPPYPPPPPPPPPPVNNPYYQKFCEDYWKKYAAGYAAPPGMPLPPAGAPFAKVAMPLAVAPPPLPRPPATRTPDSLPKEEYPIDKTDRETFILATPDDVKYLSEKQCYVRTRLAEIFLSTKEDTEKSVRSRKAGFVNQIGMRCVFCVPYMDPKDRVERAICYPTTINKFYQTVQDMQHFHFNTCPAIPADVRLTYQKLKGNMNNKRSDKRPEGDRISPKEFWLKCCRDLGLADHIGDDGGNAGVKLSEGHGLVERSKLMPDYVNELFMPPNENEEGEGAEDEAVKEEEMMEEALEEAQVEDEENAGGFDKLVADLDGNDAEENDAEEEEEGEDDGGESC